MQAAISSNCASLLLHARQRRAYKDQILVELATMSDMDAKRKQPDKHIPKHAKQLCQKGRGQKLVFARQRFTEGRTL